MTFFEPSFSQEGEDRILTAFLKNKSQGFYVDVGAHHPFRFSNTYIFYLKKWSGINIEARPGSLDVFRKHRPRDINLEVAINDHDSKLTFYEFNDNALNTFDGNYAENLSRTTNYKIVRQSELSTKTLKSILDTHLPPNQKIDFLTVDVEGLDLSVLKSNDWQKYRPHFILCEVLNTSGDIGQTEISHFMKSLDYEYVARTLNTVFFKDLKHAE